MATKKINTDLQLTAKLLDGSGSAGTSGQILSSTGTATDWISLSEISGVDGTGTANYIAKWSDTDTITNSVIYDNGTNVGIGTTSPSYRFTAYGSNTNSEIVASFGSANDQNEYTAIGLSGFIASNGATKAGLALKRTGVYGTGELHFLNNNTLDNSDMTLSDSKMMIDSSGNVGIGTTSPQSKLHVLGTTTLPLPGADGGAAVFGNTTSVGYGLVLGTETSGKSYIQSQRNDGTATTYDLLVQPNGGNVGIGTTSPARSLHVKKTSDNEVARFESDQATSYIELEDANTTGQILIGTQGDNFKIHTAGTERFRIDGSGNVGIGTTSPIGRLNVVNGSSGQTYSNISGLLIDVNGTSNSYYGLRVGSSTGNNHLCVTNAGNVGIGTTSPGAKLHIEGDGSIIRLQNNSSDANGTFIDFRDSTGARTGYVGTTGTSDDMFLFTQGAKPIRFYTNASERMHINSSGNVGIGTTSPSEKLHVAGNMRLQNQLYDSTNSQGTFNDVLTKVSAGTEWKSISDLPIDSRYVAVTGDTMTGLLIAEDGIRIGSGNHYTDGRASLTFGEGSPTNDSMYIEYDGENLNGDNNAIFIGSNKAGVGDVLSVTYGGNVGIGVTDPDAALDVSGNIKMTETAATSDTDKFVVSDSGVLKYRTGAEIRDDIDAIGGSGTGGTIALFTASGTDLGDSIITQSSQPDKITIGGQLSLQGSGDVLNISHYSGSAWFIDTSTGDDIFFGAPASNTQNVGVQGDLYAYGGDLGTKSSGLFTNLISQTGNSYFNAGNVGIGTTNPLTKLHTDFGTLTNGDVNELVLQSKADGSTYYSSSAITGITFTNWINGYTAGTLNRAAGIYGYNADTAERFGRYMGLSFYTSSLDANATEKMRIDQSGYVGIGTTGPSQKLHVTGNARITGALYDSNNSPGTSNQILSSTVSGTDWVDIGNLGTFLDIIDVSEPGNTTAEWSFIKTLPASDGGQRDTLFIKIVGGGWNDNLRYEAEITLSNRDGFNYFWDVKGGSEYNTGGNGSNRLRVVAYSQTDGTVDVYLYKTSYMTGWIYATFQNTGAPEIITSLGSPTTTQPSGTEVFTTYGNTYPANIAAVNDRVGIGTNSPTSKLTVVDDILLTGSSPSLTLTDATSSFVVKTNTAGEGILQTSGTSKPIRFFRNNGSNESMRINGNGNVGIGTTSPQAMLDINDSSNDVSLTSTGNYAINTGGAANVRHYKNINLETPEMEWSLGGSTDLNWKKLATIVINDINYSGFGAEIEITDFSGNYGHAAAEFGDVYRGGLSIYHRGGTGVEPKEGIITIHSDMSPYIRIYKIAGSGNSSYEIQVKSPANYRQIYVKLKAGIGNQVASITPHANDTNGSTSGGTAYTPDSYTSSAQFKTGFTTMTTNRGVVLDKLSVNLTSPAGKFDVRTDSSFGNCRIIIPETTNQNPVLAFYRPTGTAALSYPWWLEANGSTFQIKTGSATNIGSESVSAKVTIDSSGNVGIGTTDPAHKLHVVGTNNDPIIRAVRGNNTAQYLDIRGYQIQGRGNHLLLTADDTKEIWLGQDSNTQRMVIDSSGDVGINDTTPSYKLDVNGTIRATGDVIAYSDIRVKENIRTIENALDKVKKLRGVEYNKIDNPERSIGVIAQEIEDVLPEVVKEDNEGMKSVAYGNITAVLIEAIKEQQKQIDELKNQLDAFTK